MTFLPIVERELRVRSRQPWTYRLRVGAAVLAMVVMGVFLTLVASSPPGGMNGGALFRYLTMVLLLACVFEGARTSSDCLSGERREGTLGLLFLTDLRGYDVVLGKLAAHSLHGFYGLLAIVPVLAVALLAGGVTGGEVARVSLALLNLLFLVLALGIWVSAISQDDLKSLLGTLGLVVLFMAGPPLLSLLIRLGDSHGLIPEVSLLSPAVVYAAAFEAPYRVDPSRYWLGLALQHVMGWGCLTLAGIALRQRLAAPEAGRHTVPRQTRPRLRLADGFSPYNDPVVWYVGRAKYLIRWIWILMLLAALSYLWPLMVYGVMVRSGFSSSWSAYLLSFSGTLVHFVLYLLLAALACRFFVQARRSGMLELLLTCPLSRWEILHGQWKALRLFGLRPIMVVVGVQLFGTSLVMVWGPEHTFPSDWGYWRGLMAVLSSAIILLCHFFAIGWVGIWMAYSSPRPGTAVFKTFALVILLPWIFCSMLPFGHFLFRGSFALMVLMRPLITPLLINGALILWAYSRLRSRFLSPAP